MIPAHPPQRYQTVLLCTGAWNYNAVIQSVTVTLHVTVTLRVVAGSVDSATTLRFAQNDGVEVQRDRVERCG